MTHSIDGHDTSMPLTDDPAQLPAVFAAAFNTGSAEAVDRVYEDLAVFVPEPGRPVAGPARATAHERFLGLGLPIDVRPRHVYVADDVALLIVDWTIEGTAAGGTDVSISGTATDVAHRGADGRWRYLIDNPFGTA